MNVEQYEPALLAAASLELSLCCILISCADAISLFLYCFKLSTDRGGICELTQ